MGVISSIAAQEPCSSEIAKQQIKKIIRINEENKASTLTWYYDDYGNDTALYAGNRRVYYKLISYDNDKRVKTIRQFMDDATETDNFLYSYNADGSYKIESTAMKYGYKSSETFNEKGSPVSQILPDGSVYHYLYNSSGQLIKMFNEPKSEGTFFSNEYFYDKDGHLVTQHITGKNVATIKFEYGSTGLLSKKIITDGEENDPGKEITVLLYEYVY